MLDAEKPDAVIVTTVDAYHHEYIIRALNKGYDVISEKPITNSYEKCLTIREAEKKSGKKVTVTFNCRFMPSFVGLKKIVSSGKIGKVLSISYEYFLNRWHGGADPLLVGMLMAGEKNEEDLGQLADSFAGITSALIGISANESIATGKHIDLSERIEKMR